MRKTSILKTNKSVINQVCHEGVSTALSLNGTQFILTARNSSELHVLIAQIMSVNFTYDKSKFVHTSTFNTFNTVVPS